MPRLALPAAALCLAAALAGCVGESRTDAASVVAPAPPPLADGFIPLDKGAVTADAGPAMDILPRAGNAPRQDAGPASPEATRRTRPGSAW